MSKYVNNAGKPKRASKETTKAEKAEVDTGEMDGGEYDTKPSPLDAAKLALDQAEEEAAKKETELRTREEEIAKKEEALAKAEADARSRLDAEVKAKLETISKQQEEMVKQQEMLKQQAQEVANQKASIQATRSTSMKVESFRDRLLKCFVSHAKGHVDKHLANIEVLLTHPVGVGNNGDIIEEIEKELDEVAKYDDLLDMVEKYLK